MREIVHLQAGQCGNQIGSKVFNDQMVYSQIIKIHTCAVCMHWNQLSSEFERKTTLLLSNKGI